MKTLVVLRVYAMCAAIVCFSAVGQEALVQMTEADHRDMAPMISPGGDSLTFASNRTGNFDLGVMGVDGRNLRQLTTDPADEKQPCWSSDGAIYYTRHMSPTVSNIWRVRAPE
ncbi:MAG: hypothetical protein R6V12_00010 [Candidatus Hydrogenedentota bacterium]